MCLKSHRHKRKINLTESTNSWYILGPSSIFICSVHVQQLGPSQVIVQNYRTILFLIHSLILYCFFLVVLPSFTPPDGTTSRCIFTRITSDLTSRCTTTRSTFRVRRPTTSPTIRTSKILTLYGANYGNSSN